MRIFSDFAIKGLYLRTIDWEATTASQERAIAQMETPVAKKEGELF